MIDFSKRRSEYQTIGIFFQAAVFWLLSYNQNIMLSNNIDPPIVAIAVITSYPKWYVGKLRSIKQTDKIRGDLALESINRARNIGYQVVAGDWCSSKTFVKEIKKIPGVIFFRRRNPKSSPAKRLAIKKASKIAGVKLIVLTEPEKASLIKDCIPVAVQPILKGEADIVVPKRNDELFKRTYPAYQYESESEGNNTYNEELRSHKLIDFNNGFDMFFGPRIFQNKKQIVSLFMKRYIFEFIHLLIPNRYLDAEELSNTNFFPIVSALKKGFRVKSVEVAFEYPFLQRRNEETGARDLFIEKRKSQRIGLIIELLHFVAFLENYHKTRIKKY